MSNIPPILVTLHVLCLIGIINSFEVSQIQYKFWFEGKLKRDWILNKYEDVHFLTCSQKCSRNSECFGIALGHLKENKIDNKRSCYLLRTADESEQYCTVDDCDGEQVEIYQLLKPVPTTSSPTVEPTTTTTLSPTEEPIRTTTLSPTEEPITTTISSPSEEPTTTTTLSPTEEPITTKISSPSEEPTTTTTSSPTEEPITTTSTTEESITTTSTTKEPITTTISSPSEEPTTTTTSSPTEESIATTSTTEESITTTSTTEEPTSTTELTTTSRKESIASVETTTSTSHNDNTEEEGPVCEGKKVVVKCSDHPVRNLIVAVESSNGDLRSRTAVIIADCTEPFIGRDILSSETAWRLLLDPKGCEEDEVFAGMEFCKINQWQVKNELFRCKRVLREFTVKVDENQPPVSTKYDPSKIRCPQGTFIVNMWFEFRDLTFNAKCGTLEMKTNPLF